MCDKKNSVLFNDTECIVLSPNFKLTDESQVLLKVPRKNNMYSVDLNNIVPKGGLTCLFAKATSDESELWHRRLGHINFKTMNKLVKGNLFDGKADEGFFVRYSINSKTFRVFNSRTRIVEENLYVQFSENIPNIAGSRPNWLFDIDALTKSLNYKPVVAGNQSNGNAGTKTCDDAGKTRMETVPGDDEKNVIEEPGKEGCDPSKEDERDDQEKDASVNNTNNVNATSIIEANVVGGKTSIELLDDPNMPALEDIVYSDDDEDVEGDLSIARSKLIEAMQDELLQFKLKKVWTLVDLPNGKRPIGTKWVFRNKKDERGIVIKNKARLVDQGYTQEEGINYDKVFAPVVKIEEIRLFLAYASFKDFMVYQMDVKSAFLYGKIEEEVYVCQPPGFEDPNFPDRVYKVEKGLYGLHQAPRAWTANKAEGGWDFYQSRQCKKHTVVANSTTEAEYVAASSCCGQMLWIQNQLLDYGDCNEKKLIHMVKIHTDKNLADLLTKAFDFADTHNLVVFLSKPAESEGFEQIVDFLKANPIRYALTINPTIYTSCIKQFWATVKVKTINGEVQLQALVNGKKIIVTKASVRRDLQLNDEEGTDCLPNATIFEELTRMGYTKLLQKLTFYKAFFSPQWKFLIHTILQCVSAKTTAWNE
ncbi:putative ribonuclease H-like domain-containing protein, partial [Tanacetum coccineum]